MRLLLCFLAIVATGAVPEATDDESSYLLASDDLDQLTLVGFGPETIAIKDKEVRLTGKPNGYFATKRSYKNYVLKFEWMYEAPEGYKPGDRFDGNSGVLVHIVGDHKVWPKCVEVQGANAEAGHIFAINGAEFSGMTDKAAQARAIKPVGEWNDEEIRCEDGAITSTINGVQVATGTGASPAEGPIGFQSEGAPIRFRYLRIKPLE